MRKLISILFLLFSFVPGAMAQEWETYETATMGEDVNFPATIKIPKGWEVDPGDGGGMVFYATQLPRDSFCRVLSLTVKHYPGLGPSISSFDDDDWKDIGKSFSKGDLERSKVEKVTHKELSGAIARNLSTFSDKGQDWAMDATVFVLTRNDDLIVLSCALLGPKNQIKVIEGMHAADDDSICKPFLDSFTPR